MASETSAAQSLPRIEPSCDVRKLAISPTEAFILSRIDGMSDVVDLANGTGLPESTVLEALDHLSALGAIIYSRPGGSKPATLPGSPASDASGTRPVSPFPAPARDPRASGVEPIARYDRSLLEEDVDIPMDQRMDLLDLFFSIDVVNHYDLLGVAPDADRKAIKQAYFERATTLHPDRFFGKSIGSYKARIERVFTALTKAHDTLTKRQSRADYDAYLSSRQETVGLRSSRLPTPPSDPPTEEPVVLSAPRAPSVAEEMLNGPDAAHQVLTNPVLTEAALTGRTDAAEAPPPPPRATPEPGQPSDDALRRQMARKLRGSQFPSVRPASPAPESPLEGAREALEANLRARYEARLRDPSAPAKFVALAAEAERAQSWASAVNALKTALELRPDDEHIRTELARVELLADRAYAGKFVEQARYEEQDGQFERASRSYERAARGRSSAELYALAAMCQLRADGGGRRAVELARRAVVLGPTHVPSRLALARAYFQQGMAASAIAEATRALEVEPKNEEAKRLLAEFRKSG